MDKETKMLTFSAQKGWGEADIFPLSDLGALPECFSDRASFGDPDNFSVEVFTKNPGSSMHPEFGYAVWINIGSSESNLVGVPTIGDLLALLRDLQPLCRPKYRAVLPAPAGLEVDNSPVVGFLVNHDDSVVAIGQTYNSALRVEARAGVRDASAQLAWRRGVGGAAGAARRP